MSVTYPDLTGSVFPDFIDELMNFMDVDIEELPYANQYYAYVKAGDLASAQTVLASRPRLQKMVITAENLNTIDQRLVAIERYVTMNQKQILFDATQPTIQVVGDIWAKIIATSALRIEVEFYEKTASGYLPIKLKASMIEFADGQDAETKLGGINGISDSLVSTNSSIAASSKAIHDVYYNLSSVLYRTRFQSSFVFAQQKSFMMSSMSPYLDADNFYRHTVFTIDTGEIVGVGALTSTQLSKFTVNRAAMGVYLTCTDSTLITAIANNVVSLWINVSIT